MIDAATFAVSYNAFWNAYTPTCEHFVRRLNLDGYERFEPPMEKSDTSKRRALIAEYAFSLFVEAKKASWSAGAKPTKQDIELAAWTETEVRLRAYANQGLDLNNHWSEEENKEILEIYKRLSNFFVGKPDELIPRPLFYGCGFIDASEGDVIFKKTIYEIKTVDRAFRSSDVRQVITYTALNFASEQYQVDNIGLFNPRRGEYCEFELDYVCSEISGRSAPDLLAVVVNTVSSGEISR